MSRETREPGRRRERGGSGPRRRERRVPPPDRTGDYGRYLAACREDGREVEVHLTDGSTRSGVVESFDVRIVSLRDERGVVEIRTDTIRYIAEA